jgi:hypothetical protein
VRGHGLEGFAEGGGEAGFPVVAAPAVVGEDVEVGEVVLPVVVFGVEGEWDDDADEGVWVFGEGWGEGVDFGGADAEEGVGGGAADEGIGGLGVLFEEIGGGAAGGAAEADGGEDFEWGGGGFGFEGGDGPFGEGAAEFGGADDGFEAVVVDFVGLEGGVFAGEFGEDELEEGGCGFVGEGGFCGGGADFGDGGAEELGEEWEGFADGGLVEAICWAVERDGRSLSRVSKPWGWEALARLRAERKRSGAGDSGVMRRVSSLTSSAWAWGSSGAVGEEDAGFSAPGRRKAS